MEKKIVVTENAPAAIGPYSQAVKVGEMVFLSGQIPLDAATGELIQGGLEAQTKQVLRNLKAVLEASGSSLEKVVKTNVFIKSMKDFPLVNEIYATFFKEDAPARACVEVSALPKDALVEIEAVAIC